MGRSTVNVRDAKTITLPKTIPLLNRIVHSKKQISEWLTSLERPFDFHTETLRLTKYNGYGKVYTYKYEIIRKEE